MSRPSPDQIESLVAFVAQLRDKPPCAIEKGSFEVKGWGRSERELWKLAVDATVCLTNADGGVLLIGPEDDRTIDQTPPCPHLGLTTEWVADQIRKFTHPPVQCQACRLGDLMSPLLPNITACIAVFIPKKTILGMHTTHSGVCFVRRQDYCEVDHLSASDDYSSILLERATLDNLSPDSIQWAIKKAAGRSRAPMRWHRPGRSVSDLLADFNLIQRPEGKAATLTLACLLLFGKRDALASCTDGSFLRITIRDAENLKSDPYTDVVQQNIVDTCRDIWTRQGATWSYLAAAAPEKCIQELLVNALIHRCYRSQGPINIRLTPGELMEIQNPGGFARGLNPHNLIHGNPVHRNRLLSEAASLLGFCEKSGSGIDIVYAEAVAAGYDFPYFAGDCDNFSAMLPLERRSDFAKFIQLRAREFRRLESLLIVRHIYACGRADVETLGKTVQRPVEYTRTIVQDLVRRNVLLHHGPDEVDLTESVRSDIEHPQDRDQGTLFG